MLRYINTVGVIYMIEIQTKCQYPGPFGSEWKANMYKALLLYRVIGKQGWKIHPY